MPSRSNSKTSVISRRLRQERLRNGMAQDFLGVLAGLEESSASARMSRYESGIHEPPFEFVNAVAKALEISPAIFYCPDDRLADLIRFYSGLPEAEQAKLHKTIMETAKT